MTNSESSKFHYVYFYGRIVILVIYPRLLELYRTSADLSVSN